MKKDNIKTDYKKINISKTIHDYLLNKNYSYAPKEDYLNANNPYEIDEEDLNYLDAILNDLINKQHIDIYKFGVISIDPPIDEYENEPCRQIHFLAIDNENEKIIEFFGEVEKNNNGYKIRYYIYKNDEIEIIADKELSTRLPATFNLNKLG